MKQTQLTAMVSTSTENSITSRHRFIPTENKMIKRPTSSLRHRTNGINDIFDMKHNKMQRIAQLFAIFFLCLTYCHSTKATDDTLYLYDDDLYDSYYYDDDYSSALTKYYKEGGKSAGQHNSGKLLGFIEHIVSTPLPNHSRIILYITHRSFYNLIRMINDCYEFSVNGLTLMCHLLF